MKTEPGSLFKDQLTGDPYIFDFSPLSQKINDYDTKNYDRFQRAIFEEMKRAGASWGIGRYLENRETLLRNYPQMIEEKRTYHAGLDIIVPANYKIYSPFDGIVFKLGKEQGLGNYGGYIILKHEINKVIFYSFYGHLNSSHRVAEGDKVLKGDFIGSIGEQEDSGGWFSHVHIQILTEKAMNDGMIYKGYITELEIQKVEDYFPSPYHLFKC